MTEFFRDILAGAVYGYAFLLLYLYIIERREQAQRDKRRF